MRKVIATDGGVMNIPFEPLEAGGYREIYRLACTVSAFFTTYQHWPETLVTDRDYLIGLFKKIPKKWHEPLLKRLRFEVSSEAGVLIVTDGNGQSMDYSTTSSQVQAQIGCDWLFSRPVKIEF
jgi:hypothetical protein